VWPSPRSDGCDCETVGRETLVSGLLICPRQPPRSKRSCIPGIRRIVALHDPVLSPRTGKIPWTSHPPSDQKTPLLPSTRLLLGFAALYPTYRNFSKGRLRHNAPKMRLALQMRTLLLLPVPVVIMSPGLWHPVLDNGRTSSIRMRSGRTLQLYCLDFKQAPNVVNDRQRSSLFRDGFALGDIFGTYVPTTAIVVDPASFHP
jgi:hypothetical protein